MKAVLDLRRYRWGLWPDDLEDGRCGAAHPNGSVTCELPPDHIVELVTGRTVLEMAHLGRDHRYVWHYWAGILDEYEEESLERYGS